ncbi:MAG TPA: UDP-N-acetylmuramoyl-L-alanine--D-glutamate ligase [Candidatus Stackebrandtia excrementipullorum]|nr:UDP-N-acetylmuramoyl-L-alanine--D-glutamate ligase [Candidatus Stackebrandtia excrementipullorum]
MTRYLVAGSGIAGAAMAKVLIAADDDVTVYDRTDSDDLAALADMGAKVVVGEPDSTAVVSAVEGADDVVVSPGFPPHHSLVRVALGLDKPVYSEPELAWRLRPADAAPWLAVTGTNGKTTTVTMLASILAANGLRTEALGNIGRSLVDAVTADYDVLAVELSSQQLHWSSKLAPEYGALLNLAEDHLSWHGGFDAYAHAKTAVWRGGTCVGNLDDPEVSTLLKAGDRCRIGFTLGVPGPGQFGVRDGMLVDHSGPEPVDLIAVEQVRPAGRHHVANALAASALARSFGVTVDAVVEGLVGYEPQPHRNVLVTEVDGTSYVDDSKATNPHAAAAALEAYDSIVWVAGGQLKGVDVDPLIARAAPRLRAAVVLGADRREFVDSLRRHAPGIPVVEVTRSDDEVMDEVVTTAARLASFGDVVLLSPAAASYDMFSGYAERGRRFATAAESLAGLNRP